MEHRLFANDVSGALRAAHRLGGAEAAIVKARAAVNEKSPTAKSLIDALPASAHQDPGVMFSRIQMLRRADKYTRGGAADAHGAPRRRRDLRSGRVVDRAAGDCPQAPRPQPGGHRLQDRPRRRDADQGELPGRARIHRRLDRAALPQGSRRRGPALRPHHRHLQPDRDGARQLLARPRRRGDEQAAGRPRAFTSRRPATTPPITASSPAPSSACAELALASTPLSAADKRAALAHNEMVARRRDALRASTSATSSIPIVADLAERSPDIATLAALAELAAQGTTTRAAPCWSARVRSAAASRSITMPTRPSGCRIIRRSDRRSSRRWSIPSRARRAPSIRRTYRAPTRSASCR